MFNEIMSIGTENIQVIINQSKNKNITVNYLLLQYKTNNNAVQVKYQNQNINSLHIEKDRSDKKQQQYALMFVKNNLYSAKIIYILLMISIDLIYQYNDISLKLLPREEKIDLIYIHQIIYLQQLFNGLLDAQRIYQQFRGYSDLIFYILIKMTFYIIPALLSQLFLKQIPFWHYKSCEYQQFLVQYYISKKYTKQDSSNDHCTTFTYQFYNIQIYNYIFISLTALVGLILNKYFRYFKTKHFTLEQMIKIIIVPTICLYIVTVSKKIDDEIYQPIFYYTGFFIYQKFHEQKYPRYQNKRVDMFYSLKLQIQKYSNPHIFIITFYIFYIHLLQIMQQYDINNIMLKLIFTASNIIIFILLIYLQYDLQKYSKLVNQLTDIIHLKPLATFLTGQIMLEYVNGVEIGPYNWKTLTLLILAQEVLSTLFFAILLISFKPHIFTLEYRITKLKHKMCSLLEKRISKI